jgi:hypothetical protein
MTIKNIIISEFKSESEREQRVHDVKSAMPELSSADCKVMIYQPRENALMLVEVWIYSDAEGQAAIVEKWGDTSLSPPIKSTYNGAALETLSDINWQE